MGLGVTNSHLGLSWVRSPIGAGLGDRRIFTDVHPDDSIDEAGAAGAPRPLHTAVWSRSVPAHKEHTPGPSPSHRLALLLYLAPKVPRSNIAFPNLAPEVRQRHLCHFDPLEISL